MIINDLQRFLKVIGQTILDKKDPDSLTLVGNTFTGVFPGG